MSLNICSNFPVTESEFSELDKKYGKLCEYISWELIRKNTRNNHTDDQQDISQELKIALIRAASYFKRQVYIESCLELCDKYAKDKFTKLLVKQLTNLWENKTKHGAARQKFGPHQESMLDDLIKKVIPSRERPSKNKPLKIDSKFGIYCKSITWNQQKSMGKKISREKEFRVGCISLSEFDYLGSKGL